MRHGEYKDKLDYRLEVIQFISASIDSLYITSHVQSIRVTDAYSCRYLRVSDRSYCSFSALNNAFLHPYFTKS